MPKKRTYSGRKLQTFEPSRIHGKRHHAAVATPENALLTLLYQTSAAMTSAEIFAALAEQNVRKNRVQETIDLLLHESLIRKDGRRRFILHANAHLCEGTLTQNPKGFGFVSLTRQPAGRPPLGKDVFITNSLIGDARHGDRVLIRVLKVGHDDRAEGVVLTVLARGADTIAGIYWQQGKEGRVFPDDPRFPFTMVINPQQGLQPNPGDAVIVRYRGASQIGGTLPGEIVEILGPADQLDNQLRMVIEKFRLPHLFPEDVLREAARLKAPLHPEAGREDLRQLAHVTIDGETAKDFDDAICVEKSHQGYRLYVSIADVSYFVTPGSALDQEAYLRGTSVYLPGRVIPMLPERLANDLCSLVPGLDRFCLSAILDFDLSGTLQASRFTRSVILSRQRFTYTTVKKILVDKDPSSREEHRSLLPMLESAEELVVALQQRRRARGSIDFNLAEAEFALSESGEVTGINRLERNLAHLMIEEFMLAANQAVAARFTVEKWPALYRIHEAPDPGKILEFVDFLPTLEVHPAPFVNSPGWFAAVLRTCQGTRHDYLINNLVLRNMQQARYSPDNIGHFGLAAPDYTHFTSPIRRYPDLMVHRQLLALNVRKEGGKTPSGDSPTLSQAGEFLSNREREAMLAERDMHDRLKISYMKSRLGEVFTAVISGVTEAALFIELQDLCLSGSISLDQLNDDHYFYDSKNHRLFGEIHRRIFRIGDPLEVVLVNVDNVRKRLNFKPTSTTGS